MAANTRARSIAYSKGAIATGTELQTIQVQAAQSVNRGSTASGWRALPLSYSGAIGASQKCHWHGYFFDDEEETIDVTTYPPGAWFDLQGLPHGHQLSGLRACFLPSVPHGQLPEYQPVVTVYRAKYGSDGGTMSAIATVSCAVATYETYDAGFVASTSFTPITIDRENYRYLCSVESEWGSASESGLNMLGMQAQVIIDDTEGGPDFTFW